MKPRWIIGSWLDQAAQRVVLLTEHQIPVWATHPSKSPLSDTRQSEGNGRSHLCGVSYHSNPRAPVITDQQDVIRSPTFYTLRAIRLANATHPAPTQLSDISTKYCAQGEEASVCMYVRVCVWVGVCVCVSSLCVSVYLCVCVCVCVAPPMRLHQHCSVNTVWSQTFQILSS